ncbi:MAG: ErfK/YbiS/YcfS/YnhG family protein [Firmicutes bacterium]|nr:ErfK/YbiS/YcfS/YnhG family protein [Bacillota bacterium]
MRVLILVVLLVCSFQHIVWAKPEIHINVPEMMLRLYDNDKLAKEYPVAVGTPYEQTPVGSFEIFLKEQYPTWTPGSMFKDRTPVPPGPNNPLGSRWLEFKPTFGIHGTNKDWDIEYPVSGGCIRMHNADVEELYELVDLGTPVIITYQLLLLQERDNSLFLIVLPDIYNQKQGTKEEVLELFRPYANRYKLLPGWKFPDHSLARQEVKIAIKDRAKEAVRK